MNAESASTGRISHLVIKPTHGCNQRCPYCRQRRQVFGRSKGPRLTLQDWQRLIDEADELGNLYLDISGGEPLLYPFVPELIWTAKRKGWFVSLNTNGLLFDRSVCARYEEVMLDRVIVSCISLDDATNDAVREKCGTLDGVRRTLDLLADSSISVVLHCIVCRHNYNDLSAIIAFAFEKRVSALALVYPENASRDDSLRMRAEQIRQFRKAVLPEAIGTYALLFEKVHGRDAPAASMLNLSQLYGKDPERLSLGQYGEGRQSGFSCGKPSRFALVYANGDVLPCNGVEYTGEPLMGNVKESSLSRVIASQAWQTFARGSFGFCAECPVPDHTGIAIMSEDIPPYTKKVVRSVPTGLPEAL